MTVRIGTSGFIYPHWEHGVFYPEPLPRKGQFEYYCDHFDTVELNVTFYRLPSKASFESWKKRSPRNFLFTLKGSRYITHLKRLKDPADSLRVFYDQARPLIPKTACVLWQLPPHFHLNLERLRAFIALLKRRRGPRHAFEFRHESWFVADIFEMLSKAGMSICRADHPVFDIDIPGVFPFEYLRRHGAHTGSPYTAGYSDAELRQDAGQIRKWTQAGKDVFVFFNNDAQGQAPKNALRLKELVKSSHG